jgi:hypothetical protein
VGGGGVIKSMKKHPTIKEIKKKIEIMRIRQIKRDALKKPAKKRLFDDN